MNRKPTPHVFLGIAVALAGTGCAADFGSADADPAGSSQLTLSLAYDQPHDSSYGVMADEFATSLERLSGGDIKVKQYPAGALGDEPALVENTRAGNIDIVFASMGNISTAVPESAVFSLHYLYEDLDHLHRATNDPQIRDEFEAMVEDATDEIHGLGITTAGFRSVYATGPVESADDLDGMRFRIQPSQTEATYWSAYGALPSAVDFSELYTALQTGAVAGAENTPAFYHIARHHEVADHLSLTRHIANQIGGLISGDAWKGLSAEQQNWVIEAFSASAAASAAAAADANEQALEELRATGVQISEPETESLQEIAYDLTETEAERLGQHASSVLEITRSLAE